MNLSIGIVVFPGFQLLDACGPVAVFEAAHAFAGPDRGYKVQLISAAGGLVQSSAGVMVETRAFSRVRRLDTVLVVGGAATRRRDLDPAVIDFIRRRAPRCRRVTSVCTGAFVLARAGVLDGRRATAHWRHAGALARRYPVVRVSGDAIWINDGKYWTSAGVAAGIDLALALVEEDCGPEVAQRAARENVVYYRRPGGQSQFSTVAELGGTGKRFGPLLAWIRENIAGDLRVEDLAEQAAMSPRNFSRRFRAEMGQSPAQTVAQIRVEVARALVETTALPMEQVALRSGFGDSERMRRAFVKLLGRAPRSLRTETRQAS